MGNRESVTAPSVKSHLLHLKLGTDLLSSCRKDGFVSTGTLDAERPLGRCSKQLMAQWAPSPIPAGSASPLGPLTAGCTFFDCGWKLPPGTMGGIWVIRECEQQTSKKNKLLAVPGVCGQ